MSNTTDPINFIPGYQSESQPNDAQRIEATFAGILNLSFDNPVGDFALDFFTVGGSEPIRTYTAESSEVTVDPDAGLTFDSSICDLVAEPQDLRAELTDTETHSVVYITVVPTKLY